jgi:hypothetical protein
MNSIMPHSVFSYDFDVQSGSASAASNRFVIVFRPIQTLPVASIRVVAQRRNKQEAVVQWNTTAERDVLRFEVQRSRDGIGFETVGSVPGASTPGISAAYSLTDREAGSACVFYRIAIMEQAGAVRYSDVYRIQAVDQEPSVLLYSVSEQTGAIGIECIQLEPGNYSCDIFTAAGQLVQSNRLSIQFPVSRHTLHLGTKLASGTYQLRVTSGRGGVFHRAFSWKR